MITSRAIALVLGTVAGLAAMPSSAAVITWNTDTGSTSSFTSSSGNVTATPSAFSTSLTPQGAHSDILVPGCLRSYSGSGLGVVNSYEQTSTCNADSPNHAIDNSGKEDGVLFRFSSMVQLTDVAIGWVSGDSDFSVYWFNMASGFTPDLAGQTLGAAPVEGWTLLNHYNGGATPNIAGSDATGYGYDLGNSGASAKSSMYWFVSAFNVATLNDIDYGDDFFKLKSISGVKVPEPASLALLGLGMIGMGIARRVRRQA